jgi:RNA polymerase sigma factor (sigma-70 family)
MRSVDRSPVKLAQAAARVTLAPPRAKKYQSYRLGIDSDTAVHNGSCILVPDDVEFVRAKIWRLVAVGRLRAQDSDDLVQLALVHVWERLPEFRADRGSRQAFVNTLIRNFTTKYLTAQCGKKRRSLRTLSLSEPMPMGAGEAVELGDMVLDRDRRRRSHLFDLENVVLSLDLATAVSHLPPLLREIAERRWLGQTSAEIACAQGVHRSTINRRMKTLGEMLSPRFQQEN